jgi:hypothetical protein
MSEITISGSALGSPLEQMLMADCIVPGYSPSYQICKEVYLYHPLGGKIVEKPVTLAQSQQRKITIAKGPEEQVRKQFELTWKAMKADELIRGTVYQSRIYGVGAIVYGAVGVANTEPMTMQDVAQAFQAGRLFFNVLDPLNTAGSLVLNQDPNAPDFQKQGKPLTASGEQWHFSRSCVMMNEQPVYIAYSYAAFGYVGRSVYQRALFPLKSFVQSMITDDMVTRKAGLLIAMLKQASSIVNRLMQGAAGLKRQLLGQGQTNNVLSIDVDESIESINLQNTDTAMTVARKNIIENIASACDMPAKLLLQESFAEGFGEGTEDAKDLVRFVNGVREKMQPLYDYFDPLVMHCAWTPEFFKTIVAQFPDMYSEGDYQTAFYDWCNGFAAVWPSLQEEPESEQAKTDKVMIEGVRDVLSAILPSLDPENKALLVQWAQDNLNERKRMFTTPMLLDIEALAAYEPPVPDAFGGEEDAPSGGQPGKLAAVK